MKQEWFASAAISAPILVSSFKQNFTPEVGVTELIADFLPTPCKCPKCKRPAYFRFIRTGFVEQPEFTYYVWACMNCGVSGLQAVDKTTGKEFIMSMDSAPRLKTLTTIRKRAKS